MQARFPLRLFPALLACLLGGAVPGTAQQAPIANGTVFGAFTLQCEAETVQSVTCALVQTIVAAEDKRFLAELGVNLGAVGGGATAPQPLTLVVRTPAAMRLAVPPAYLLAEGTQETPVPWLTCAGEFCLAALVLDESAVTALRAAPKLTLGYLPLDARDPVSFDIALDGLSAGLQALGAVPSP